VLLAAPKALQAVIAAYGDYYTYKLARQIYGRTSIQAWLTLVLTVTSAWQWFCSTRTFSNCLETSLTVAALYNWPFHWALARDEVGVQVDEKALRVRQTDGSARGETDETTRLRRAILCAAFAVILRPTNAIIWIVLTLMTFGRGMWHLRMHREITAFLKEGISCGGAVLVLSILVDRIFYGVWTFPPWNFLKFNVFQSIAVFYGNNNRHYYLTQGYPLLLTGALIWAGMGLYEVVTSGESLKSLTIQSNLTLHRLAVLSLVLPAALSVLSHKEVRFIYPILPALHILAASPFARVIGFAPSSTYVGNIVLGEAGRRGWLIITVYLIVNMMLAGYTSLVHGSGVIAATNYLRQEFEIHYLHNSDTLKTNLTFAAFMPCHSIPWRSHLHYPPSSQEAGISGWALTCEPPINLDPEAKLTYVDEADIFYNEPVQWIKRRMSRDILPALKPKPGIFAKERANTLWTNSQKPYEIWLNEGEGGDNEARGKRTWPGYVLFFEQLEPVMKRVLEGSAYAECARFFNSHAHDDWRRKGDVVVWCLHPERALRHLGDG